jgi:hypothetical protein
MTQTIAQQIKWDFKTNGDLIIRNKYNNAIYFENSFGFWAKCEYDSKGNVIYYENSDEVWEKWEYDSEGNLIYFEDSDGEIEDNRPKPLEIPTSISVGVYYYIDEETGKPVFDTDSMTNEFETKLNNL